jgi:two-component system, LuxR family, sensor kinase FixL
VTNEALQRKIPIIADTSPDVPNLMGDSIQLQQVFLNLILNGFDAVEKSVAVSRKIIIQTSHDTHGTVCAHVSDNGSGVQSEDICKIFDSFYTTKPEGIGMGLSISRFIIEAHGGRIWCSRNAQDGMTFHISLPVGSSE